MMLIFDWTTINGFFLWAENLAKLGRDGDDML